MNAIPESVKNSGLFWVTIYVELLASDNTYLQYPVNGWLQIQEISTTGRVTGAAFVPDTGRTTGKVGANRPSFRTTDDH